MQTISDNTAIVATVAGGIVTIAAVLGIGIDPAQATTAITGIIAAFTIVSALLHHFTKPKAI